MEYFSKSTKFMFWSPCYSDSLLIISNSNKHLLFLPKLCSDPQLARRCHTRSGPGRRRLRRNSRGNDALVPRHMPPEAPQGGPLSQDVHPPEGPGQGGPRRRRVHAGAPRMVRDMEETICGKLSSRGSGFRCRPCLARAHSSRLQKGIAVQNCMLIAL